MAGRAAAATVSDPAAERHRGGVGGECRATCESASGERHMSVCVRRAGWGREFEAQGGRGAPSEELTRLQPCCRRLLPLEERPVPPPSELDGGGTDRTS